MGSSSIPTSMRITQPSVTHGNHTPGVCLIKCQIYLPITYALNQFALAFATIVAVFVWLLLEKRSQLWHALSSFKITCRTQAQKTETDRAYADTPSWWYLATTALSLFLAIFCCEYWKVQLPWYGVLLAFAVSLIFFVPVSQTLPSLSY
jgi:hypothetical protein